jgi:nitrogen fixation-related uncharacterized protein
MYYPYFITYMVAGFAISVLVFYWALANGQFRDQQRARFLPLEDEPPSTPVKAPGFHRLEIYALLFLAVAGIAATVSVLVFALFFHPGHS